MAEKELVFALTGNPNSGKTTLFNLLTGSCYEVGNFAGVTVECKAGICRFYKNQRIKIIDLPGIYSLSPNSNEEQITYDYIKKEKPDLIIDVTDASNLQRNLFLTTELQELETPVIMALNMIDALADTGTEIDIKLLQKTLGISVIPISAKRGKGIEKLISTGVLEVLGTAFKKSSAVFKTADARQEFIRKTVNMCVKKIGDDIQTKRTDRIDNIACHPMFAIPLFIFVMLMVFEITFGSFGSMLSSCADKIFNIGFAGLVSAFLDYTGAGAFIKGLVLDGIISGVGAVVSFFPQIMLLFLFMSVLEASGYMARTEFIMDRFFIKLGLSGKSIVPMIMGFGCSVPAVMSARTLENKHDRNLTILMLPFMSCGAKMPVYAVITAAFFPLHSAIIIFILYIIGIILAIISGFIFSKTILKGDTAPFILEMPCYRIPPLLSTLRYILDKTKDFAYRAGTVILLASIIIWLSENLDIHLHMTSDKSASILGTAGKLIAPVFTPCGFGTWQSAVSLISGLAAKEAVVASMRILYHASSNSALACLLLQTFSPLQGFAMLVFILLYIPCTAAVSTIYSELHSIRLTLFSMLYQAGCAWILSMLIYQIGSIFV